MPSVFTYEFNTPAFKGKTSFNTGLYVNGQFVDGSDKTTIDVVNPTNGQVITKISEATPKDVDLAVNAAETAFEKSWGLNVPGNQRGELLYKLAQLMERNFEELVAIEALDNGKTYSWATEVDIPASIETIRYYAGWADKVHGKTIETSESKLAYTRHEPIGVVGQIIPGNFPLLLFTWNIAPALATGNCIIMKPSEFTPLTAIRMCGLIREAGFPPGVVNIVTGYGNTVGAAISSHMRIEKVAFTGSTLVGRKIMESAAKNNLKRLTLVLGGKSPNIIYDDADLDKAVNWTSYGIFWNHGQTCGAGSRIFVQSGIYDKFLAKFMEKAKSIKVGDPFTPGVDQGPQRIMGYIDSGKQDGATVHFGGERVGNEGYFISPTIFTNVKPEMKIVKEEIFGPVGVVIKLDTEEVYGLAAAAFTQNLNRAIETAHKLKAGTTSSGIGRELGEYALDNYTNIKAVHVNLGHQM
ncbi:hypothetical protein AMATHDRAFT_51858 [Amanita thiersii Skay4041]|uniref:Aldehyde dehydrogenase domain-containing protein n=1 Tax=Amanita thiersii Skay4041 TaxID=703135 RepID=A0A2A9NB08_9AGAR|nr:hypothetical protein AMATHDRAFT_51858 [Amanita thiersii Skay4041]